jgi:hypothetical protein
MAADRGVALRLAGSSTIEAHAATGVSTRASRHSFSRRLRTIGYFSRWAE